MVFRVTYRSINERNIFSNGDIVKGKVTLEVRKSCRIKSLSITFKAESKVEWSGASGDFGFVSIGKETYFKMEHFFIGGKNLEGDDSKTLLTHQSGETYSSVVAPGCHVYPFKVQIPFRDLPASYHSTVGQIQYKLEAKLSRSMKMDKKHETEITFVPRQDLTNNLVVMKPLRMTVDQKMNLFNSGKISMDVKLEKSGFVQGEKLKLVAHIVNNSSCAIKPKYRLIRKQTYIAKYREKVEKENVIKEVGEPILRSASQNVTKVITIPRDADISILNCPNIRVEYKLRVYLDVKFAADLEIMFPVIILPTPPVPAVASPPGVSDFGFGAFGRTSPPTRGLVPSSPQLDDLPPPYESHQFYPSLTDSGKIISDGPVTYRPINGRHVFSNGDIVKSKVTLEVRKSCRIKSLSITFKAESKVEWSESSGDSGSAYIGKEKYFKMEHFFIGGKNLKDSSVVAPGCHAYRFSFQIPLQDLPASYHSTVGQIQYKLEAKLSRSMRMDKKHETEITFVPRQDLTNNLVVMTPQHMTAGKEMYLFNSGKISMDVKLEKSGFVQGEQLNVVAYIVNNSSRVIKPKYRLIRKETYIAKYRKKVETENLLKEVGEPIPCSTSQNVTKVITIPRGIAISILNCPNIRVEYSIRVYLDVKFATDPEVMFPVIILPTPLVPVASPRGVSGFGTFWSTSPPTRSLVPPAPQLDDLPPPYESHQFYPPLTDSGKKLE
ncbi:uncharacterized protein V6R79_023377 [Siganus canaliculatus]